MLLEKKKDKIQMRATTYSGVVCGVPVTIILLSSLGSQGLFEALLIHARLRAA